MANGTSRPMIIQDIPEEVICDNIFSRLPFKLVTCLKTISQHCCSQIKNDTMFAAKQAALCPSCPALIHTGRRDANAPYCSLGVLSSTPTTVGIPSSGLDFLDCPTDEGNFLILASSNGLLCILYQPYYRGSHLTRRHVFFIANPATRQAKAIPGASQHLRQHRAVGLVFDPSDKPASKQKFMIVQALSSFATTNDTLANLRFVIFSSDTGCWVMSDTTITTNIKQKYCDKVVYSGGILYWDYKENLVWFDVATSAAGVIKMPWNLQAGQGSKLDKWKDHNIDASNNGMLICTTIDKNGLAMQRLAKRGDGYYWDLKHKKGWKDIIEMSGDTFHFCHSMNLRNGWKTKFCERWYVRVLGLESERWIYIGVQQRLRTHEMVLRYDMDTCKAENTREELRDLNEIQCRVFGYRNSMAALPTIAVPLQQDGLCECNKSGGCVCATKGTG
ncbi:hypothetical protein BS78_02G308300 [Paspalum vaginatum]|nr:hypothetical protein BS78_02G308300 [Paspalum vaginatum]